MPIDNTRVYDVCCIVSRRLHWKLCQNLPLDPHVTV